ncbi:hypothetical protein [Amycolatopsis sp. w19]|uniref:hypothetical protein n=1 Tax=Amycolatopsis sp. w19 TaxID=3448134 RepID=UPI003F1CF478
MTWSAMPVLGWGLRRAGRHRGHGRHRRPRAASLSLAAGNDLKVVQAMLGHSSIVLTADTYTSVLPCLAHSAAEEDWKRLVKL